MTALSEMANGASTPSTLPVWQRELLCAREPPHVTCIHHEYDEVANIEGHALELVMKAKSEVTEEYMRSIADLMVIKGPPNFTNVRSYLVSDVRHVGLHDFDFGWGKAVYAGPDFHVASFYTRYINNKGESGIVVPIWLPRLAIYQRAR
ncbi:hypothetical protein L1987_86742 [Smallanthus sonchifolius]|uniref:Uncharacterized protein n=1 Tax=Smallanthus sonchifolius TaxID=185202 RepID=A0ACB8Y0W9_9ASTR|nr:hypothetical protein L1987_86742 [Smallanthus sonchifolius]